MSLLTEARKRYFKKVGFTDDEYKVLYDLLDELTGVDKETAEFLQSRASLEALITGNNDQFLAPVEYVLPEMNNFNSLSGNNSTKEAKLVSQVVMESVLAAFDNKMRSNSRH